jgi:transcriptional regulator with XRE-family HTH domain
MGITQREFARRMGVSPQAVNKRIRAGRLSRLPDGTLDEDVATREWHATREPGAHHAHEPPAPEPSRRGTPGPAPGTYAQAKTADTVYRARLRQLEYESRAGTFVRVEDVAERWYELARTTRVRLMSIPARVAASLAATSDVHDIRTRLDHEIRTALSELVDDVRHTPR